MMTAFDVDEPSQRSLALTSCHQITNPRNNHYYSAQFSFYGAITQVSVVFQVISKCRPCTFPFPRHARYSGVLLYTELPTAGRKF